MLKTAILVAIGAVTLAMVVASFLSDSPLTSSSPSPPAAAPGAASAETIPADLGSPPRASGYREAVLRADARGQYTADALVNGAPVRMLIDTGASIVVLSGATAARLGVTGDWAAKWTVKTANGATTAAPVVLRNVSLAGLYMNDVQAVILPPSAGEVNLLGASFLKRLMSVEQRDGMLILRQ